MPESALPVHMSKIQCPYIQNIYVPFFNVCFKNIVYEFSCYYTYFYVFRSGGGNIYRMVILVIVSFDLNFS